jgi:hypothetical protein
MATYLGAESGGGVAGSMYRRQPFTYIGQTKMSSPFKLNYDTTIASASQSTAPSIGTYTPSVNENAIPTSGGNLNWEATFGNNYEKDVNGIWWPKNPTEGQTYTNDAKESYIFTGGKWLRSGELPWIPGKMTMEENYLKAQAWNDAHAQPQQTYREWLLNVWKETGAENYPNYQFAKELSNALKAEGITPEGTQLTPTYISGTQQFEDVMKKIDTGEIDITNDDGMLDTTSLREQGDFGNWMANMLEDSYKTGALQDDFIQTNEDGTVGYTPEIQTMIDYITSGTREDQQRWQQYRRDVAGYALAQGQTVNSGYYQDALASDVANRAAQASEQISSLMTKEITSQYEYISNSLQNAFREMGLVTDDETFQAAMKTKFEEIMQSYNEQIALLAQQTAEQQAARRGDVFGGILGAMANAMLGFFL